MIPLLCQAICSMVPPSTDTWSNSNFDIPQTTGLLQNKENPSEKSIKNVFQKPLSLYDWKIEFSYIFFSSVGFESIFE